MIQNEALVIIECHRYMDKTPSPALPGLQCLSQKSIWTRALCGQLSDPRPYLNAKKYIASRRSRLPCEIAACCLWLRAEIVQERIFTVSSCLAASCGVLYSYKVKTPAFAAGLERSGKPIQQHAAVIFNLETPGHLLAQCRKCI